MRLLYKDKKSFSDNVYLTKKKLQKNKKEISSQFYSGKCQLKTLNKDYE